MSPRAHTVEPRTSVLQSLAAAALLGFFGATMLPAQQTSAQFNGRQNDPPAVRSARRFLAHRGGSSISPRVTPRAGSARPQSVAAAANWEPLGPPAVLTQAYGLVSGRVSSLALDPNDPTGNTLYAGTTGGGVWVSRNADAADASTITFTPLAQQITQPCPPSLNGPVPDQSISIGAVSVQPPGGSGVILAGTGDPNDALDSYYGAGLLRSTDGGSSWTLIQGSSDLQAGYAANYGFLGEGFAGIAWDPGSPQRVVAAVSQSYDSYLVQAGVPNYSYSGLYYSTGSGDCGTWHLATITDGAGQDVQGPNDAFAQPDGNAATAVVWNPVRRVFLAAVRFHGYYQSSDDGVTWTRLASQPGGAQTTLTTQMCPTRPTTTGSTACPIFRGALAVNPVTGDTFAWTVDENNQDQGLWEDSCNLSDGACGGPITFATQWSTALLETSTLAGASTILNGDYNLSLAAIPGANSDTFLLAGDNDLWKCSLHAKCVWRNTTNSTGCMSAAVGEYQHALLWNAGNPSEVFTGNDSGLWRSTDGIGETGPICSPSDASHWQNLNGALGSLAEVESLSEIGGSPYTLMAGLGANGTAGIKGTSPPVGPWPQILDGEGGPVAIDPADPDKWLVNDGAGVSIHLCSTSALCASTDFGPLPVISNADVADDGLTMTEPAPFLVDAADPTQLLVATCRLWRGPYDSSSWSNANAITPMLGAGASSAYCSGNPLIRTLAAAKLPNGGEVVYAGTFGSNSGGANLAGHVLKVTMDASGNWSGWTDLTLNPVVNKTLRLNSYSFDISSISIDPHDTSGNTLYVTIEGVSADRINLVYASTDGGAHWIDATSNLQYSPANALTVDPVDANTVYIALDAGVWATQRISTCGNYGVNCWFALGAGMPQAPVTALSAAPATTTPNVLVAGTYGRGIWQIPLLTAGEQMTTASVNPASLTFAAQAQGTASTPLPVTLADTSPIALQPTTISITGDFTETDNCAEAIVNYPESCTINVTFSPTRLGARTGTLTIAGNIISGNIVVNLSGTGATPPVVTLQPTSINFGSVQAGTISSAEQVTAENSGGVPAPITSLTTSGPFVVASNGCATSIAANSDCSLSVQFAPSAPGSATGTLTLVDSAGTQTVQLTGIATAPPTDTLSASSLTFQPTTVGATSAAQTVSLTNAGGNPLTSIAISASGPFLQTNNCTTSLTASASCSISVSYAPTAAGAQTGTLTVSDILKTQTVALSGSGLLPAGLSALPSQISFPNTLPGQTSSAQTVIVSNNSPGAVTGLALSTTGPFSLVQNLCGVTLAPQASCITGVVFASQQVGNATGVLTVSSSAPPLTVALSGVGFDFTYAASGGASQTVASGQTANYALNLTPGGAQASFSFQCSSLPQYAACMFNPSTLPVAANASGSESIQVTTGQSNAAGAQPASASTRALRLPLALGCGLMLIPIAVRRRRRLLNIGMLLILAAGVLSCAGSGGGGGGTPPPSSAHNTPPGTYTIPVVITSGSVQHTVNLTLVVD